MSRPTQVMTAGLLLTAAVVFAQTASQWIDFRLFDLRLAVLDSDHHASVFGAVSILAQAVAAAAIGLRAVSMRRPALLLVAALVGALTVPRALMRYVPAFERYDVPILVAPLTVACVVLCALTFRDARRVRFIVWGSLVLLACSFALHAVGPQADADGSRRVRGAHLGIPRNGHAQARRRAGRVDASRDWNGRGSLAPLEDDVLESQRHRALLELSRSGRSCRQSASSRRGRSPSETRRLGAGGHGFDLPDSRRLSHGDQPDGAQPPRRNARARLSS